MEDYNKDDEIILRVLWQARGSIFTWILSRVSISYPYQLIAVWFSESYLRCVYPTKEEEREPLQQFIDSNFFHSDI